MGLSREDRKDLARVMIAENPLTKSRERIAIEGLLAWDDRNLGISSEEIVVSPKDYETKIDFTDVEYTEEEEAYRHWVKNRLLDCKKFEKKFYKKLLKDNSPSLARHKTKWLEEQYEKYYGRGNRMNYWQHLGLNLKASLRCFCIGWLHFSHAVIPIALTSHHNWESNKRREYE